MFDFLPAEKRNVLLEYPFARAFAEGKLSVDRFLDNIHSFESELKSRGFSDSDLKALASVQQKGKDGMEILKRYGFQVDRYPELASFLAAHPDDLEEMAKAAGTHAWDLFEHYLPAVKDLINEKTWPGMVEMAKAAGTHAWDLFERGLPAVKDLINEKTWPGMVEIAKAAGPHAGDLFGHYLLAVKDIIKEKPWTWPGMVEMAKAAGPDARWLFKRGLPAVKDLINEKTWPMIVDGMVEMAKAAGPNAAELFGHGLPLVKDLINEKTWPPLVDFLVYVAGSKQRIYRMIATFSALDARVKPFVIFLVENRPKQVLDILENMVLLKQLDADYSSEIGLFLKIASPITLKDDDFSSLKSVLLPLDRCGKKDRFLGFLDSCIVTFQGVKFSFLRSLESQGFKDIGSFSFIDLVYIYLFYARNPDLQDKKLAKSLEKLQKEEGKILQLIGGKNSFADLNEMDRKKLRASLRSVSELFFELVLSLYTESSDRKAEEKMRQIFGVEVKDKSKLHSDSFRNALLILAMLKESKHSNYGFCFDLIKNYLAGNTYPSVKNIWKCYPWTLLPNVAWCKRHLKNKEWTRNLKRKYKTGEGAVKKSNVADRIAHHLEQARGVLVKLGIAAEVTDENLEGTYKKLASEAGKYDAALLSDLKTQANALNSLKGTRVSEEKGICDIVIQSELEPLEVLQMGNNVNGSCLATDGANYWSTVTNAVEVNKRVLWAKDSKDNILARLLIAVDESNRIVRFRIYYALTQVDLEEYFNDYIMWLADKCRFGINGKATDVKKILSKEWYLDPVVEIKEQKNTSEQRKFRRAS